MDYKTLSDRIEWNEGRLREIRVDLLHIKEQISAQLISDKEIEPDIIRMFDEKFRIQYALKLSNGKRRVAAKLLKMSERNLYRLMSEHKLID
jgi:hypothetical protein